MKKPAEALLSDIQQTNSVFQVSDGSPQSPFYLSNLERPLEVDRTRKIHSMAAVMAWGTIERSVAVFDKLLQTTPLQGQLCSTVVCADAHVMPM